MREENLDLAKRGYMLFGKADLDTLKKEVFDADVIWRTEGVGPFESEYRGVDALLGYFGQLFDLSSGTVKAEPLHIYGDLDRAVAIQRLTASRAGKLLDTKLVLVFEIHENRVFDVTEFAAEPSELDKFWS